MVEAAGEGRRKLTHPGHGAGECGCSHPADVQEFVDSMTQKGKFDLMKEMLKYYKPYIPIILLIIAALFGQAMCELALPGYMSDIINFGIIKSDMSYIYKTGAIMLLVALAVVICTGLAGLFSARVAAKSSRDIRSTLFRRVTAFSAAELERFSTPL